MEFGFNSPNSFKSHLKTALFSAAPTVHSTVHGQAAHPIRTRLLVLYKFITFRVRRSRGEMYIGHGRLCVFVPVCPSPHSHITARTRM